MTQASLLWFLLGCAPKAEPAPSTPQGPPPLVDPDLWQTAAAGFTQGQGFTLTPLAQLAGGDVQAIVLWPMLDPQGQVVDDDVVGLTLQPDGSLGATNWRPSPRRLSVELGGDDWQVRPRTAGEPQDALGQAAVSRASAFQAARAAGDAAGAVRAAQDFSRLFALTLVLDQTVTSLLARQAEWVFVSRQPLSLTATFAFTVGDEPLSLWAEPVPSDPSSWWFTPDPG